MIHRARFRSCKKFWPRLLTGETPISRSVVVISDNFIKIDNLGREPQKIKPFIHRFV